MSDSWRAPTPTPERRRKRFMAAMAFIVVVALVAAAVWYFAPRFTQQRDSGHEEEVFNSKVQAVVDAPAVEVSGRAKLKSGDKSPVYFTAVRIEDGTLVGDIRPSVTGFGLPIVDTGDTLYAQGDPSLWPLLGLNSDFKGWVTAPTADTVSVAAAAIKAGNVRDVLEAEGSTREGMSLTSPDGVVITVDPSSDVVDVTVPLEGGRVSEHTIRPLSKEELQAAKDAVANAVSGIGGQVIHGPGGGLIIERFADPAPEGGVPQAPPVPGESAASAAEIPAV